MPIYRLNLDRSTLLQLGAGSALLLLVVFFSGTLLGYTLSGAPPEVDPEEVAARQIAYQLTEADCPVPDETAVAVQTHPRPLWPERASADFSLLPSGFSEDLEEASPEASWEAGEAMEARLDPMSGYAVQVGAFGVRGNADALAADLRARGYEPLIVAAQNRHGDWLEHVHLSIHPDEASAQAVAENFARSERLTAVVVPTPSAEVRR